MERRGGWVKIFKHPNGYYYVRGKSPDGQDFYRSTKARDESRARQIGELWISGKMDPGNRPDASLSLSEPSLSTSLPPPLFSPVSLPSSVPSATTERSNVLEFPTLTAGPDDVRDSLAAALGVPSPVTPIQTAVTKPKKDYTSLCEFLGSGIATIFVGGVAWGMKQLDREAGKPSPSQLKELGDALADQLREWFSDTDLKPWQRIAIVSLVITVGMWLQGKPIPKPPKVVPIPIRPTVSEVTNPV
jgi:hypothetical protein